MSYLFYSETNSRVLDKQGLAEYIEKLIISGQMKKKTAPVPKMVQVVAQNWVSDTVYNYPCTFYG